MPSANIDVSITLDQNVNGEVYAVAFDSTISVSNVDVQRVVHEYKNNAMYQYAIVPLTGSGSTYTGVLYQTIKTLYPTTLTTNLDTYMMYVVWSNDTTLNNQTTQQVFAL